jgi:hypothetical protein
MYLVGKEKYKSNLYIVYGHQNIMITVSWFSAIFTYFHIEQKIIEMHFKYNLSLKL